MQFYPEAKIIDITKRSEYEKHLYRCLGGPPSRRKKRLSYLEKAIPRGFHKKLLVFEGNVVGTIEYSPSEVSYYPIIGDNITVMNCIWVLRKAKGHNFGKMLVKDMIESKGESSGFATIALTGHWSPWFRKWQMEKLGFKPLESVSVTHETKHEENAFNIHLMWMPTTKNVQHPSWDRQKLLEGTTACTAHPLYHPQSYKPTRIFQEHFG
jgi:N-acetylglutamate synthase-like GNAT family acetyltransferase